MKHTYTFDVVIEDDGALIEHIPKMLRHLKAITAEDIINCAEEDKFEVGENATQHFIKALAYLYRAANSDDFLTCSVDANLNN